jgi:hypothetical protein
MKKAGLLLVLASLLSSTPLLATPILSPDGTTLTHVVVNGYGIYEVTFGDGQLSTIFKDITFDAARTAEADAVSIGIVDALNAIGAGVYAIAGCGQDPVYRYCDLFNPESHVNGMFEDFENALGRVGFNPIWDRYLPGGVQIPEANYTNLNNQITLVTSYHRSDTVAAPAPLALMLLGITSVGITRRKSRRAEK